MNETHDLIFAALKGPYEWSKISTFANSIKQSGFKGKKVLLVSGITQELRDRLTAEGFELIDYFRTPDRPVGSYCGERLWPINDFLKERAGEFRYILHLDWRDLVVQTNPSIWLEEHLSPYKLIGCTEGMRIEEEYYNDWWLKQASPNTVIYEMARKHEICCAGTLAGEALAMRDLLCTMYDVLSTSPDKPDYSGGSSPPFDQGILNYLLRISPFKEITKIPSMSEGFTATVNWYIVHRWINRPVPTFRDGVFYPQDKADPYCIVHQYDRDAQWKAEVEKRYGLNG